MQAGALPIVTTILGGLQAGMKVYEDVQANKAAKAEAKQHRQAGQAEQAASQREGLAEQRKGDLVASRLRTAAAAGGGNVSDVSGLEADIETRAEYNALTALAGGLTRRGNHETAASMSEYRGKQALMGSVIEATGTMLETAGGMGNFGKKKPAASKSPNYDGIYVTGRKRYSL